MAFFDYMTSGVLRTVVLSLESPLTPHPSGPAPDATPMAAISCTLIPLHPNPHSPSLLPYQKVQGPALCPITRPHPPILPTASLPLPTRRDFCHPTPNN